METGVRLNTGPAPLWQQVGAEIRRNIETGRWPVDHQVPSERELCSLYGISRTTVRLAIAEAVNAGLLCRIHGKGTYVARPKIAQPLVQITSFAETLRARGLEPDARLLEIGQQPADLATAHMLSLAPGTEVVAIRLLGLGSGEPMALYDSVVPATYGLPLRDRIAQLQGEGRLMVNELLAELYGWTTLQAEQTYEATAAGSEEARLLGLPRKAPLFLVTSLFRNPAGHVVEFRRAVYRADKYRFHITRQMQFTGGGLTS